MHATSAYGVDWAAGTWVVVGIEDGELVVSAKDKFEEVWNDFGDGESTIVVDIPIGLCPGNSPGEAEYCACFEGESNSWTRDCDAKARNALGSRHSSVFNPPARGVIECLKDGDCDLSVESEHYQTANEINRELTGKGLIQQSFYISRAIAQVDEWLLSGDPPADFDRAEVVLEGHPEVAFQAKATEADLGRIEHGKLAAAGVGERLAVLREFDDFDALEWESAAMGLADSQDSGSVALDDMLDATVLALVAADDERDSIPCSLQKDCQELPMQMVYSGKLPAVECD